MTYPSSQIERALGLEPGALTECLDNEDTEAGEREFATRLQSGVSELIRRHGYRYDRESVYCVMRHHMHGQDDPCVSCGSALGCQLHLGVLNIIKVFSTLSVVMDDELLERCGDHMSQAIDRLWTEAEKMIVGDIVPDQKQCPEQKEKG